jgi:hypothetical protein
MKVGFLDALKKETNTNKKKDKIDIEMENY